jgi:hypothetical protein
LSFSAAARPQWPAPEVLQRDILGGAGVGQPAQPAIADIRDREIQSAALRDQQAEHRVGHIVVDRNRVQAGAGVGLAGADLVTLDIRLGHRRPVVPRRKIVADPAGPVAHLLTGQNSTGAPSVHRPSAQESAGQALFVPVAIKVMPQNAFRSGRSRRIPSKSSGSSRASSGSSGAPRPGAASARSARGKYVATASSASGELPYSNFNRINSRRPATPRSRSGNSG